MADRIVQLIDKNNDNIFPVTTNDAPTITVTSTDPGAGSSLAANHFVAVTGSGSGTVGSSDLASSSVTTAKIANDAVTMDKIDFSSLVIKTGTIAQATNVDMELTAGEWIVFGFCTAITSGATTPGLHLRQNGTDVVVTFCGNEGGQVWENLCIFKKITVASNDTWTFYADNSQVPNARSQWLAIKISN